VEIHQLLVSASPGDAITNSAFELRSLLRRITRSEIYAHHIHPSLAKQVIDVNRYGIRSQSRPHDDVLIYHASIGDPLIRTFIADRPERLVLMYHNISPAEAFAPYEPAFAGLLEAGRDDLAKLRDRVTLALAASEFNAAELVALGYADVRVSPLIVDPAVLYDVPVDVDTARHLSTQVAGPTLLFVGQILPHKRPDLLVHAFHILTTYLVPEANLILVGSPRLRRFRQALQEQIAELGLARAWLTGAVSGGALRAFYERADVFVTASDHEGFCVPLIEAMAFDIPVVARATTAIPETLGGAGLLLEPTDGPAVMAEAMAEVLTDTALHQQLVDGGRNRLCHFDPDRSRQRILEHLSSVV
jgi:glycosyltransferase involved in cell wall biosynthesis